MSIAATLQRSGTPILWRKMNAVGGTYDFTSATVVAPAQAPPVTIYAIIDGFGSTSSKMVNPEQFDHNSLEFGGTYHIYTVEKLEIGDVVEFGGDSFTVYEVKQAWKKGNVVLCLSLVHR